MYARGPIDSGAATGGRVIRSVGTDSLYPEVPAERGRSRNISVAGGGSPEISPTEEGQPLMAARVLIADDEDAIRRLLEHALSDAGYDVSTASNGVEAFQKFQDVDLLVTDLTIGSMDGYELCRRVRQTSALPIVVISGGALADELPGSEVSVVDADALIRKPFDIIELVRVVRSLVPPEGG